ncbi:MAG: tyrosine-type recombinase/integrase [Pseudomonas sp.]|uniref:tyrosine-type recombinase/integrase n=1 Tax=Pseudomonas sp. TaxID=306 RepID=UPI003D6F8F5C
MALSDLVVRQAKTTGKAYTLNDLDGLSLAVSPTGGKSWHFRYYWAEKQKRMSLGTYPEVSLRDARVLRDGARVLLTKGVNPRVHRKQKRQFVQLADQSTFKVVFDKWVVHRSLVLKEGRQSTLSQIQRIFAKDVLPALGRCSIYDIQRPDLLDVLARIERRKALTTAEKVRTWFRQIFRYALVIVPGLSQNPAFDLDVIALPQPPVRHNPFLRLPELPAMLQKLRQYPGKLQTQLGLRLLLLTGVRTGELRLATPDQFHLDKGLWIIPPEVVKQLQLELRKEGRGSRDIPAYIVPLSVQALEVVRHLLGQVKPAQTYLLAHYSDLKKRISENTLNAALTRIGYKDQLTGHGIRGTLSTALNEMGYPKVWIDAQLSHADPDKVSAAYNHAEYVEQRRRMMQDWADRLDLLEQGHVGKASRHLTIQINGVPALLDADPGAVSHGADRSEDERSSLDRSKTQVPLKGDGVVVRRLAAVQVKPEPVAKLPVSNLQRERMEMLETYEAPGNLPVSQFAKLAGKSRDQVNREIKAGKLLTLTMGNRGQRIPEWQLDPLKHQLIHGVLQQTASVDTWLVYRTLSQPMDCLGGRSAVEAITPDNFRETTEMVCDALSI